MKPIFNIRTRRSISFIGLFFATLIPSKLFAEKITVNDKDLAIIIPKDHAHDFPAFSIKDNWGLLSDKIYTNITNSFLATEVGNSITEENSIDEWAVVSARISPCSALYPSLRTKDSLCWPELRVVLQPILKNKINYQSSQQEFFADDRNVHALYHASPYSALSDEAAKRADAYIETLKTGNNLNETQYNDFVNLRNLVASNFLKETKDLRISGIKEVNYEGFDIRPEFYKDYTADMFTSKFTAFLKRHAFTSRLHTATAFSLPAGRMPSHSDLWVFKKYIVEGDEFVESDITLHHKGAQLMLNTGKTNSSTMQSDDPVFTSPDLTERQKRMISHHVVFNRHQQTGLLNRIADPNSFLVEHTSCASCHKLNQRMPANFHAMSYFINEPGPTVIKRVRLDVKDNLNWINNNL